MFDAVHASSTPAVGSSFKPLESPVKTAVEFNRWVISDATFCAFVAWHASLSREGIVRVPEAQADTYGPYAIVGPNGCFFDNSQGTYRYSRPIVSVGENPRGPKSHFQPTVSAHVAGTTTSRPALTASRWPNENNPSADFTGHASGARPPRT